MSLGRVGSTGVFIGLRTLAVACECMRFLARNSSLAPRAEALGMHEENFNCTLPSKVCN